jgi:hypothetical protein
LTAFGFADLGTAAVVAAAFDFFLDVLFAVVGATPVVSIVVLGAVFRVDDFVFAVAAGFLLNGVVRGVVVPVAVCAAAIEAVRSSTKVIQFVFMTGSPYLATAGVVEAAPVAGAAGAGLLES